MASSANEINDRFLIKLSGEAFAAGDQGVDAAALDFVGGELLLAWRERPRFVVTVGGAIVIVGVVQHLAPSIDSMLIT